MTSTTPSRVAAQWRPKAVARRNRRADGREPRPGDDPELERELVRLRHEAFATLDRAVPTNAAPVGRHRRRSTTAGHHRGGAHPDVLRNGILRHGSLHVGSSSPARVRSWSTASTGPSPRPRPRRLSRQDETTPWFEPFRRTVVPETRTASSGTGGSGSTRRGGVWAADSPRMLFELFETLERVGLRPVITEYLGERPALAVEQVHAATCRPSTPAPTGTRTARSSERDPHVTCGSRSRTAGEDAPGLDIVPPASTASSRPAPRVRTSTWSVGPGVVDGSPATTPRVRPGLRAGRRPVLRRPLPAPHRDRPGDDPRPLRDRDLVLRAVGVPGAVRPARGLTVNNHWAFLPMRSPTTSSAIPARCATGWSEDSYLYFPNVLDRNRITSCAGGCC